MIITGAMPTRHRRSSACRQPSAQVSELQIDLAEALPANPKLDTLLALASQLGIRIVIDVAHAEGLVIRIDDQG